MYWPTIVNAGLIQTIMQRIAYILCLLTMFTVTNQEVDMAAVNVQIDTVTTQSTELHIDFKNNTKKGIDSFIVPRSFSKATDDGWTELELLEVWREAIHRPMTDLYPGRTYHYNWPISGLIEQETLEAGTYSLTIHYKTLSDYNVQQEADVTIEFTVQ